MELNVGVFIGLMFVAVLMLLILDRGRIFYKLSVWLDKKGNQLHAKADEIDRRKNKD